MRASPHKISNHFCSPFREVCNDLTSNTVCDIIHTELWVTWWEPRRVLVAKVPRDINKTSKANSNFGDCGKSRHWGVPSDNKVPYRLWQAGSNPAPQLIRKERRMWAFYGQVLTKAGEAILAITLPLKLYEMYLETIANLEAGNDIEVNELCRADLHGRIQSWWDEKYPHLELKLEETVSRDLAQFKYIMMP